MCEVLIANRDKIDRSDILRNLGLTPGDFVLCSIHRAENVDSGKSLKSIFDAIRGIAERESIPVIVSAHPRTRQRLSSFGVDVDQPYVRMLKPLSFSDYNCLQKNAKVVMSDSGTISEESAILGFRALNSRTSHERPEAMETATSVVMTGTDTESIMDAYGAVQGIPIRPDIPMDYQSRYVSEKVVKIILSYTSYVRRNVYGGCQE